MTSEKSFDFCKLKPSAPLWLLTLIAVIAELNHGLVDGGKRPPCIKSSRLLGLAYMWQPLVLCALNRSPFMQRKTVQSFQMASQKGFV